MAKIGSMEFTYFETGPDYDFSRLLESIPELRPVPAGTIEDRLTRGALPGSGISLVAEFEGHPIGFKLGYAISSEIFYSWLGGVSCGSRGHGVARALMEMQEGLARERGFQRIQVKSMNRFPAMLRMLIAAGYRIIDLEKPESAAGEVKVVFEKTL